MLGGGTNELVGLFRLSREISVDEMGLGDGLSLSGVDLDPYDLDEDDDEEEEEEEDDEDDELSLWISS